MRLLLDQNLSRRLVDRIGDAFPGSTHVTEVGLSEAADAEWSYARQKDLAICTKDSDFNDLLVLRGAPPSVLWLRMGNCTTADVEALLRFERDRIAAFEGAGGGLLILG